jgi:hypothetical protein
MLENNKEEHLSYVDIDMSWGIWLKNWPMCCDAPWCTINSIVCHPKSLLSNVGKVVNSWMIWRCSLDQSRIRGSHLSRQTIKLYNQMRSWSEVGMPQLPCVLWLQLELLAWYPRIAGKAHNIIWSTHINAGSDQRFSHWQRHAGQLCTVRCSIPNSTY